MQQGHNFILARLGKALHIQSDDITHEPLPKRWVDLILHLEAKQRQQPEIRQAEAEPSGKRQTS
jgi:hypothetical protein